MNSFSVSNCSKLELLHIQSTEVRAFLHCYEQQKYIETNKKKKKTEVLRVLLLFTGMSTGNIADWPIVPDLQCWLSPDYIFTYNPTLSKDPAPQRKLIKTAELVCSHFQTWKFVLQAEFI